MFLEVVPLKAQLFIHANAAVSESLYELKLEGKIQGKGKNNRAKIEGKTQGKGKGKTTNYYFPMVEMHQGVLAVVVVVVGLLASLATGEETTIASTSAEPFWLGKDCVRNEDGEWSLCSDLQNINICS